jgi:hypothetical protein
MTELIFLAVAGLSGGAALSAGRHRAPRRLVVVWCVLAAIGAALAVLTLGTRYGA